MDLLLKKSVVECPKSKLRAAVLEVLKKKDISEVLNLKRMKKIKILF